MREIRTLYIMNDNSIIKWLHPIGQSLFLSITVYFLFFFHYVIPKRLTQHDSRNDGFYRFSIVILMLPHNTNAIC